MLLLSLLLGYLYLVDCENFLLTVLPRPSSRSLFFPSQFPHCNLVISQSASSRSWARQAIEVVRLQDKGELRTTPAYALFQPRTDAHSPFGRPSFSPLPPSPTCLVAFTWSVVSLTRNCTAPSTTRTAPTSSSLAATPPLSIKSLALHCINFKCSQDKSLQPGLSINSLGNSLLSG